MKKKIEFVFFFLTIFGFSANAEIENSVSEKRKQKCKTQAASIHTKWTTKNCTSPYGCTAGEISAKQKENILDQAKTFYIVDFLGPASIDQPALKNQMIYSGRLFLSWENSSNTMEIEDHGIFNPTTKRLTSQEDRITMKGDWGNKTITGFITSGKMLENSEFSSRIFFEICKR